MPVNLKTKLEEALSDQQAAICRHISEQEERSATTAIEKVMEAAFHLKLKKENNPYIARASLIDSGGVPRTGQRLRGFIDCVLLDENVGLEYKAIRLPRQHSLGASGKLFDIGQLSSDYIRLAEAKKLSGGYVVAFVYGPLVEASQTPGVLYRHFHNQMFVDFSLAEAKPQPEDWADKDGSGLRPLQRMALSRMGWDEPWFGTKVKPDVIIAKCKKVAAVCVPVQKLEPG